MKKEFKQIVLYASIYITLYLVISLIFYLSFKDVEMNILIPASIAISYIFSPRFKEVDTQSGKQQQVKWIFMKKKLII